VEIVPEDKPKKQPPATRLNQGMSRMEHGVEIGRTRALPWKKKNLGGKKAKRVMANDDPAKPGPIGARKRRRKGWDKKREY